MGVKGRVKRELVGIVLGLVESVFLCLSIGDLWEECGERGCLKEFRVSCFLF